MSTFEYALFGNRDGSHQLLETSLTGEETLLEQLRFLVDRPAGHVGPEVVWSPYWGCGPLGEWWALWRGDEDSSAPRKNMVKSRVVIIRRQDVNKTENIEELLHFLQFDATGADILPRIHLLVLCQWFWPLVVPGISIAPLLLIALWPRLWPALRRRLAIRTFFGSESLASSTVPDVVVIPSELRLRWRSQNIVDCHCDQPVEEDTFQSFGTAPAILERLLKVNKERLPGDFTALERLRRIATGLTSAQRRSRLLYRCVIDRQNIRIFP